MMGRYWFSVNPPRPSTRWVRFYGPPWGQLPECWA
jgi:hypothetical protein